MVRMIDNKVKNGFHRHEKIYCLTRSFVIYNKELIKDLFSTIKTNYSSTKTKIENFFLLFPVTGIIDIQTYTTYLDLCSI